MLNVINILKMYLQNSGASPDKITDNYLTINKLNYFLRIHSILIDSHSSAPTRTVLRIPVSRNPKF